MIYFTSKQCDPGHPRKRVACAVALLLFFSLRLARAEPEVNSATEYYDVSADTLGTLLLVLQSEVPERPGGKTFHGYTRADVNWHWQLAQVGARCRVQQARAIVNIQTTLPRLYWTTPGSEVERVWQQWMPALARHEQQHANNAIHVARRGEHRLLGLPPQASCEAMNAQAQRMASQLHDELRKIDRDYDNDTRHGETEGATLQSYLPRRPRQGQRAVE
ncbi:MAG: DUF922 domain-containing Zn-dependent protease [Gammaproteobacteria bacterium]|nr:DUF922 domain-containing Zn-dependent protease [Gammaproteobacteria bacterium]